MVYTSKTRPKMHFNPRSLTGATSPHFLYILYHEIFQSTLPYGSDIRNTFLYSSRLISIHAPLRERQSFETELTWIGSISIHAPLRERQQQQHG